MLTSAKRLFSVSKLFVNIWLVFCGMRGCPSETHLTLNKQTKNSFPLKEERSYTIKKKFIYIYIYIYIYTHTHFFSDLEF